MVVIETERSHSPHSTAKTNDKNTNLGKNGISHVAIASVHSENLSVYIYYDSVYNV